MDLGNAQHWLEEVEQELDRSERRLEVLQEHVRRLRGVEQALRLLLSSPGMVTNQAEGPEGDPAPPAGEAPRAADVPSPSWDSNGFP